MFGFVWERGSFGLYSACGIVYWWACGSLLILDTMICCCSCCFQCAYTMPSDSGTLPLPYPSLALLTYSGAHTQVRFPHPCYLIFWPTKFNQFDCLSNWLHWRCDTHKIPFCSSSAFQLLHSFHPSSLFSEPWQGRGMNVLLRAEWSTIADAWYFERSRVPTFTAFHCKVSLIETESSVCVHKPKFLEAVGALSD